ncbi:MAG: hypothetical protein M1819_002992 [Sarea resinae]|nr:MAG: hypothetical protein M1819_002992 [Sarea resinae]
MRGLATGSAFPPSGGFVRMNYDKHHNNTSTSATNGMNRPLLSSNSSSNPANPNNTNRPLLSATNSSNPPRAPLTPRIAASHSPASSSPIVRRATHSDSAAKSKPGAREEIVTPIKSLLNSNITPRSSSRKARVDGTGSTPLGTPTAASSSFKTSTNVEPTPRTSDSARKRAGLGISGLENKGSTRPKSLHTESNGYVQSVSAPPSADAPGDANRADKPPMFFRASDANTLPSMRENRQRSSSQTQPPRFIYANGEVEKDVSSSSVGQDAPSSKVKHGTPSSSVGSSRSQADPSRTKFFHANGTPVEDTEPRQSIAKRADTSLLPPTPPILSNTEAQPPVSAPSPSISRPESPAPTKPLHPTSSLPNPQTPSQPKQHQQQRQPLSPPMILQMLHSKLHATPSSFTSFTSQPPPPSPFSAGAGPNHIGSLSQGFSPSAENLQPFTISERRNQLKHVKSNSVGSLDSGTSAMRNLRLDLVASPSPAGLTSKTGVAILSPSVEISEPRQDGAETNKTEKTDVPLPSPSKAPEKSVLQQMNELAASARRERKILDLEISNASLLAINRTLEREMKRQTAELRRYRRLSRQGRISIAGSIDSKGEISAGLSDISSEDENEIDEETSEEESSIASSSMSPGAIADSDARHREKDERRLQIDISKHQQLLIDSQRMNQSLKRCLSYTEELIDEGKKSLDYSVKPSDVELGGRVLPPPDGHEPGPGDKRLLRSQTEERLDVMWEDISKSLAVEGESNDEREGCGSDICIPQQPPPQTFSDVGGSRRPEVRFA